MKLKKEKGKPALVNNLQTIHFMKTTTKNKQTKKKKRNVLSL